MENIKVAFLGTGNAIPTKKRTHTAILASFGSENILVDCGEGTQRQLRHIDFSPTKLTRILITHWHGDHFLGLPGLFQTMAMSNYQKTLKIYGPKGTKRFISLIEELIYQFRIKLEVHEIERGVIIDEKDFLVEAAQMTHRVPAVAYSLILKDRIRLDKKKLNKFKLPNSPILKDLQRGKDIVFNGKKIRAKDVSYGEKGKKVTFVLDTSYNENAVKIAKDSDLLIAEASFCSEDEEKAKEYGHMMASQSGKIAKLSKSKLLLLTHISQKYEHDMNRILKEAQKVFKNSKIVNEFDSFVA